MKNTLILILILFITSTHAQIKKIGKVSKKEFTTQDRDKEANAIILFKDIKVNIEPSGDKLIQKRTIHKRILILNDQAFGYATITGRLYKENRKEEKVSIKAYTLNLEHNRIIKTKLNKKDIYIKPLNKHWKKFSFTLPNIKVGSIIDYQYTITSPFYSKIDDIYFQELIPIHYMEASIVFPDFLKYKYFTSRYFPVIPKAKILEETHAQQSSTVNRAGIAQIRNTSYVIKKKKNYFTLKNVPAFKIEPYLNSYQNYIGKLIFELEGYEQGNDGVYENLNTTWEEVASTVYFSSKFGEQLKKTNFFKNDLDVVLNGKLNENQKIEKILSLVKNKIKWNGFYSKYSENNIANAYRNHTGNYADVNLTLTAMLKAAGLDANPVLISTVDNGISLFPTLDGYNAVITGVKTADSFYLLDATDKFSYLNILPERDLNWTGRLVKKDGTSKEVYLFPKKLSINKKNMVIKMDEDGEFSGLLIEDYFNNYALKYRHKYEGLIDDKLKKEIEDKYDNEIEVDKIRIKNQNILGADLKIISKISLDSQTEEMGNKIIFSPLLFLRQDENIFKADERKYPLYFAFPKLIVNETRITIPVGFKVEKIPEKVTYKLPDDLGIYVFNIEKKGNMIITKAAISINSPLIPNTKYKEIKSFFDKIVLKEEEKVVLSK